MDWACATDALPVLRTSRAIIRRGDGEENAPVQGTLNQPPFGNLKRDACGHGARIAAVRSISPERLLHAMPESLGPTAK